MSALLPGGKLQLFIQQTLIEHRLCCWRCSSERASLEAQTVKNLPAMQETRVPSLGGEDPLEEEMTTHYSILAWRIQAILQANTGAWQAYSSWGHRELAVTNTICLSCSEQDPPAPCPQESSPSLPPFLNSAC